MSIGVSSFGFGSGFAVEHLLIRRVIAAVRYAPGLFGESGKDLREGREIRYRREVADADRPGSGQGREIERCDRSVFVGRVSDADFSRDALQGGEAERDRSVDVFQVDTSMLPFTRCRLGRMNSPAQPEGIV